jgi:hypothetical protein
LSRRHAVGAEPGADQFVGLGEFDAQGLSELLESPGDAVVVLVASPLTTRYTR